jgi:hypothetical protein
MSSRILAGLKNPKDALYVITESTNRHLGQIIYKNTAGFTNNIRGNRIRKKYKQNFLKSAELASPEAKELQKTGYLVMEYPFEKSLIDKISKRFDELIEDEKFSFPRGQSFANKTDERVFSREIFQGHKHISESILLLDDNISKFLQQYYGGYFKVEKVEYWRNYHVPSEVSEKTEAYSNRWHCDARPTTSVKLFVYLTDVTEDDGPFHCQSISRTKELVKMGFHDRHNPNLSEDILEDPKHCKKMTGNKGAAVWCNTELCFHRADIPKEGHYRDIIQYQFAPSETPLPSNWHETFVDAYTKYVDNST